MNTDETNKYDHTTARRDGPEFDAAPGSAKRLEVSLGALEPPLCEQLKGLAPKDKLELLDEHASKITWLYLHGLLNDRETDAARRRLMGRIKRTVEASPSGGDMARLTAQPRLRKES